MGSFPKKYDDLLFQTLTDFLNECERCKLLGGSWARDALQGEHYCKIIAKN